ncbi:hypothetical protein AWZ03_009779 [Drosophila navojoa]|uniref:Uncharacterized protein n=1 Tax=Drosophila navojoa TaxID=7232 RepID=A0A484B4I9_DRONA|nr:hypothetical protein AWZ03_009779 [Drosophila navojoa]
MHDVQQLLPDSECYLVRPGHWGVAHRYAVERRECSQLTLPRIREAHSALSSSSSSNSNSSFNFSFSYGSACTVKRAVFFK